MAITLFTALPAAASDPQAVAARVGGEPIFLGELLEGAGSLALVGKETIGEQPGTRERLLERLITAKLLWLDGRDRGLEDWALFREDLHAYADPLLATRYTERLRTRLTVSEEELSAALGTAAVDAAQRRQKRRELLDAHARDARAAEIERLRSRARVEMHRDALSPDGDACRDELTAVATVGAVPITWRRVRARVGGEADVDRRVAAVQRIVDQQLLADAAHGAGIDSDAGFRAMVEGFRRREMVKLVREEIIAREGLDEAGVKREYEAHRDRFTLPEQRKVQQIVVRTRAEADDILAILAAPPPGVSFYTLARDRSLDPLAPRTLGVIGWVTRAQGDPALTELAFSLKARQVGGPLRNASGFHVVRVIDERPAETAPLDADTKQRIRARWNANRIRAYASRLAAEKYPVEIFPQTYHLPAVASARSAEQN